MKSAFIFFCIFLVLISKTALSQPADSLQIKAGKNKLLWKDVFMPTILTGTALIALTDNEIIDDEEFQEGRNEYIPRFNSRLDDWMPYAPALLVYASELAGEKAKNDFLNQTVLLIKAEIIMNAIVQPLKRITRVERPDGSNHLSFPSGHVAQAFVAAAFLDKELGDNSILYSIAGYSIATTVGLYRMANNKHWGSDVLAGAAIGLFSVNVAYRTHQHKWNCRTKNKMSFIPCYTGDAFGLAFGLSF